ncbi:MAG: FAD-binding oxidoreductase [Candidatus Methanofastidiosia archaeon]
MVLDKKVYNELEGVVGQKYISQKKTTCYAYSNDWCAVEPPGKPDAVCMPANTEEIQAIMRIAWKNKVNVIPWVCNLTTAGMCNAYHGGLIIDLRRMNKVEEINTDALYAVVEGGLTWADFKREMVKRAPGYVGAYTYSPPASGVVTGYLLCGMMDIGLAHGDGSYYLNGLEAVMPNGELVRIGSHMISPYWGSRAPVIDLTGLFVGWAGTTGIVTKAGIKIYKEPAYQEAFYVDADTVEHGYPNQMNIAKQQIACDIASNNWAWGRVECGEKMPFYREKGEAELQSWVVLQAASEKLMDAKIEVLKKICAEDKNIVITPEKEGLPTLPPGNQLQYFHDLPMQLTNDMDGNRGGIGQWVGCYVPSFLQAKLYRIAEKIYEKRGYVEPDHPIMQYNRVMENGHETILRFNVFQHKDASEEEKEKDRALLKEIGEAEVKLGAVIYKPTYWASRVNMENADPNTVKLIKTIKDAIDPYRIMNRGQIGGI